MTRRSGLGRGLDALLPADAPVGGPDNPRLRSLDASAIEPNPNQPRRTFAEDELDELAASIAALGILQPVLVRARPGGRYELVAGERRLRAARRAGLREIPALVVDTDERGSLERALVENIHRSDLDPLEEAAAYKQLLDEGGLTQEQLGRRLGKSRATIANALRLLELPISVQRHLTERKLTGAHALALLTLAGNPFMERLAARVAAEGLTVRETQEIVRKHQTYSGVVPRRSGSTDRGAATDAQRKLADHLQTRVRVDMGARKGRIVIDFVSLEELDRLLGVIMGSTEGGVRKIVLPDDPPR